MSQFFVNSSGLAPPPTLVETLTANDASVATAVANNINVLGNNTANNGFATWTNNAGAGVFHINSYGTAIWVVNPTAGVGTHQTVAAAIASASSGDIIFITQGTYNVGTVTLKSGVSFIAYGPSDVTLVGTFIDNGVTVNARFSNIGFQTNAANILTLTDASSSIVFDNCDLQCSNAVGLSDTAGCTVSLLDCTGNVAAGQALYSGSGVYLSNGCYISGNTIIASNTTGGASFTDCSIGFPISISSSGSFNIYESVFDTSSVNTTSIINNGNQGSAIYNSRISSGTASALTGSASSITTMSLCVITTTNVSAISSSGTVIYSGLTFTSSNVITSSVYTPNTISNDSIKVTRPGSYPYTVIAPDALVSVDTSSAANTVTLPASPVNGQKHIVKDRSANAATFNITVSGNGHNIVGTTSAATQVISLNGASVTYVYDSIGTVWLAI
jgi:hypothetical protein